MQSKTNPLLAAQRKAFHQSLLDAHVLSVNAEGVATNADKGNKASREIAATIAGKLMVGSGERQAGQTSGAAFEDVVAQFVEKTFPKFQHLRPGEWEVLRLGNNSARKTWDFAQYEHLSYLAELTRENKRLAAMIGNDYMVAPDVVVYRMLYEDAQINEPFPAVDTSVARKATLRAVNGGKPILHASISAKWTMRSDRAQNSRTEALNLIRNRKGSLPHIVVVTGEPLPSRLASLALGTGDIDCLYHFALPELIDAVHLYATENRRPDIEETLGTLLEGSRIKDISDLPLDLCV